MQVLPKDGEVLFFPNFFSVAQSDAYFAHCRNELPWKHEAIVVFGKSYLQPRLTAWCGDYKYRYSGITMHPQAWSESILEIKRAVETVSEVKFNGALFNFYRDERDGMGWHRDAEKELGPEPVIGSVSFGADRKFLLRHRYEKNLKTEIELSHGSLLVMRGSTQHFWEHSIPKTAKVKNPRINMTLRRVIPNGEHM